MSTEQYNGVEDFFYSVAEDLFSGPYLERYDPAVLAADKRLKHGDLHGSFTYAWTSTEAEDKTAKQNEDPDVTLVAWYKKYDDFDSGLAPKKLIIRKLELTCEGLGLIIRPHNEQADGIGLTVENDFEWYFVEVLAEKLVEDERYDEMHPIMVCLKGLRGQRSKLTPAPESSSAA